jgi:hypothetical protein
MGGGRSVTDPNLNAWYDSAGAENGDKCAWNFGTLDEDGGMANQQWNGHFYVLQQEWDNAVSGCVQQGRDYPAGTVPQALRSPSVR